MRLPIIINDSFKWDEPGDLSVYDSTWAAKSALESDDVGDDRIYIIDRDGAFYKLVVTSDGTALDFVPNFDHRLSEEGLRNLLSAYLNNINRKFDVDASVEKLLKIIFDLDPNPYSGVS